MQVIAAGVCPGECTGSQRMEESFAHHASRCALGPVPAWSQLCAATAVAKEVERHTPSWKPTATILSVSVSFHHLDALPLPVTIRTE